MCLVEALAELTDTRGLVRARVGKNHLFLRSDGTLFPEVYCELIAQSFAACQAQRRVYQHLPLDGGGFLASIRDFTVFKPARLGDELLISSALQDECFGTHIVQGEVWRGEEKLAQAVVYIFMWEGKDMPTNAL